MLAERVQHSAHRFFAVKHFYQCFDTVVLAASEKASSL